MRTYCEPAIWHQHLCNWSNWKKEAEARAYKSTARLWFHSILLSVNIKFSWEGMTMSAARNTPMNAAGGGPRRSFFTVIQLVLCSIRGGKISVLLSILVWVQSGGRSTVSYNSTADFLFWQKWEISGCFWKQKVQPWDGNSEWQPMINMKRSPWPAETMSLERSKKCCWEYELF